MRNRQISFHIHMRIVGTILQSIISISCGLKDTAVSVVDRIAVFVFASIHLLMGGQRAREIADISNLIVWLEQENPNEDVQKEIQDTLSSFLQHNFYQELPKESCLLTALKAHRYSLHALWRGVAQNHTLLHQMYFYLRHHNDFLPPTSPVKQKLSSLPLSDNPPKPNFNENN